MKEQNFKNHARLVPGFHGLAFLLIFIALTGSIVNLATANPADRVTAALLVIISVILVLIAWYARVFALKAQDRAIRAEENFRYYILAGKPLPASLRLSQIIALRFAADEELVALTERALSENLSGKEIKQAVRNWKADHHRA